MGGGSQDRSVRFDEALARLENLPARMPQPPLALMPVRVGENATRRWPGSPDGGRPAAVLVLIFPDDAGNARVILTERATGGRHHSGEISFPGGRAELEDADLVATALREAAEEIGLEPAVAGVRVVGSLEPFWIPVSNYLVTPVIALAARRPRLRAAPDEIARIVDVPLAAFLGDAAIEIVERTIDDWTIRYGAYAIDGLSVWGATARVLGQLGALLATAGSPKIDGNRVDLPGV
jgi:8-oxo-dGTP pyrophosphatase MutT (NUDIX family)